MKGDRAPQSPAPWGPGRFPPFAGKSSPRPILPPQAAAQRGPEPSSGLMGRAKPGCAPTTSITPHPTSPTLHPHIPATESQTKEKQSPLFISVGVPGTPPQSPLPPLLSGLFLIWASVCSRLHPPGASPEGHHVQRSSLPALGAAQERRWHLPHWPEPGGTGRGGGGGAARGGLSGVWAGWGGRRRGSPVTRGPERAEDFGGGRRRRGLRSPQYTHP